MKMQKPDGYVAVGPDGKMRKYTFAVTKLKCQKKMADVFCNEKIFRGILKRKLSRGWTIKPIFFKTETQND